MTNSDPSQRAHLDFRPKNGRYSLVQFLWNNILINKADDKPPIIDVSHKNITDLLTILYSDISFVEFMELYWACEAHPNLASQVNWQLYLSCQKMTWNDRQKQLLKKLQNLPTLFLDWCHLKQVSSQDLMPLNALDNLDSFCSLTRYFDPLKVSRNHGKKIIDLLVDLILLDHPPDKLKPSDNQDWSVKLEILRKPKTSKGQTQSQAANWPRYVNIKSVRHGDQRQYQMQILFKNQQDLKEKLLRLSEME